MDIAIFPLLLSPFFVSIFLILVPLNKKYIIKFLGVSGILISFLSSAWCYINYNALYNSKPITIFWWHWLSFIFADIAFLLDPMSLTMSLMITFISCLISIFSMQFMDEDLSIKRYFSLINFFVGMMLILVMSNNLALLYLGWEGVGIASYLLIGFWYGSDKVDKAAIKAFLTTRIGDLFLLCGIITIGIFFGTLEYQSLFSLAQNSLGLSEKEMFFIAMMLLLGAMGKSAQVPLHIWLPDAMVGPTPVSALIHAATMVTAGVYLIARCQVFFLSSALAQWTCLAVGMVTALLAALQALGERDIKRVLAYSTMSQLGLMFCALGVGASDAALFHLFTHAFFKALLFLSAGVIGHVAHEYDMHKLHGMRKLEPISFYGFLLGGLSLSGFPLITAGFYSKEAIFSSMLAHEYGTILLSFGLLISLITTMYIFKTIFFVFFGENNNLIISENNKPRLAMKIPIFILSLFSLVVGVIKTSFNSDQFAHNINYILLLLTCLVFLLGILLAWFSYKNNKIFFQFSHYIDDLYSAILINPYKKLSAFLHDDFIDGIYYWLARVIYRLNEYLSYMQTGFLRHYVKGVAAILIVLLGLMVAR